MIALINRLKITVHLLYILHKGYKGGVVLKFPDFLQFPNNIHHYKPLGSKLSLQLVNHAPVIGQMEAVQQVLMPDGDSLLQPVPPVMVRAPGDNNPLKVPLEGSEISNLATECDIGGLGQFDNFSWTIVTLHLGKGGSIWAP